MLKSNTIAIIGAGQGGTSLLSILLQIPGIHIKYVSDINPEAPGIILAKRHKIEVLHGPNAVIILEDPEIDMIFEVTGNDEVFNYLQEKKLISCNIMCASMVKIIFFLLNSQQEVANELREYKLKLAERIIKRTEELENANNKLREQIDIQQEVTNKLQEINNEKTNYLHNTTHQLKAPFAAIQSYTDLLIEGYTDELTDKVLRVIQKIKARCILLSNSIRQMLELAKLNSVIEEDIVMSFHSLGKITKKVINSDAGLLKKRKISITFLQNEQNDRINCNGNQIETLVQILVNNAINYSYDNSEIEISIDHDSRHRIILAITDHGIGIEGKSIRKIFNEYFRTYNAVKQYDNGAGLGLAIARRIAKLHHSDILVDSKFEKGSTFMVPFQQVEIK